MIKVLIDLLVFMRTTFPLVASATLFALLFIILSKSVKKHYYVYYSVFAAPFALFIVPFVLRMCGVELPFNLMGVPVLGEILRDYVHAGSLGHPLLIIIMYMGALDAKNPYVKRLMSIRKEISIISGFPIITHSIVRTLNNFPAALKYFTNHSEYMEYSRATSELGLAVSNTALVLGIVMFALFLLLWITSFDAVRKRMGGIKWKKTQQWSYVLYALLFVHAAGLQTGFMLNPRGGRAPQRPQTETVAQTNLPQTERRHGANAMTTEGQPVQREDGESVQKPTHDETTVHAKEERGGEKPTTATGRHGHGATAGIADIKFDETTQRLFSIASLLLIYGSYLVLRLRKAKKQRLCKNSNEKDIT